MKARALLCPSCGGRLDPDARACPQCGVTAATRRCGVCFAVNLLDARNCRHCGRRLPREDPAHRPQRLACAGCGARMTPRRLDNVSFDECDHCGGLWLCPRTIETVHTEAEARARLRPPGPPSSRSEPRPHPGRIRYRRCPVCAKLMNRTNYARVSGVILDVCREHGSYFDRGEVARVFRFIEQGGLAKARQRAEEERRARQRDERRAAIRIGAAEPSPRPLEDPFPTGGLELLGWLSDLFS